MESNFARVSLLEMSAKCVHMKENTFYIFTMLKLILSPLACTQIHRQITRPAYGPNKIVRPFVSAHF